MLSLPSCAQNAKAYAEETSNITLRKKGFCQPELANNLKTQSDHVVLLNHCTDPYYPKES